MNRESEAALLEFCAQQRGDFSAAAWMNYERLPSEEVAAASEEMAAQVQELAAQAEELAATAEQLQGLVAVFRVEGAAQAAGERRPAALRRVA